MEHEYINYKPRPIRDVLYNPGIGFSTFQRFNGDISDQTLYWSEGYDGIRVACSGSRFTGDTPPSTLAYFRIYWATLEPEQGRYRWDIIDDLLKAAREHSQKLMLRIMPHGYSTIHPNRSPIHLTSMAPPEWYLKLTGDKEINNKVLCDPVNPLYLKHFGGLITLLGQRYNGHPDIESIDISVATAWGESGGDEFGNDVRQKLVATYIDNFPDTQLVMQPSRYINDYPGLKYPLGWRVDCLGNVSGGYNTEEDWLPTEYSHMFDNYPYAIASNNMTDIWKTGPVQFEVCWVMRHWLEAGFDIEYIIEQSLKWHISTFNNKSSPVPEECMPLVNDWLRKMGYRLALRRLEYPKQALGGEKIGLSCWWENSGVAPCYKSYPFAVRLRGEKYETTFKTDADIRRWLPGDNMYRTEVTLPEDMPDGFYNIEIALLDFNGDTPAIRLAQEGRHDDGWYFCGRMYIGE